MAIDSHTRKVFTVVCVCVLFRLVFFFFFSCAIFVRLVVEVLEACLVAPGDDSTREPDLVIVQHLTILCRQAGVYLPSWRGNDVLI